MADKILPELYGSLVATEDCGACGCGCCVEEVLPKRPPEAAGLLKTLLELPELNNPPPVPAPMPLAVLLEPKRPPEPEPVALVAVVLLLFPKRPPVLPPVLELPNNPPPEVPLAAGLLKRLDPVVPELVFGALVLPKSPVELLPPVLEFSKRPPPVDVDELPKRPPLG